jgi:hypothetical protein
VCLPQNANGICRQAEKRTERRLFLTKRKRKRKKKRRKERRGEREKEPKKREKRYLFDLEHPSTLSSSLR